jgi:hypothetical protein
MCPQAAADYPPPNHADRLEYEQLSSSKSDFLHADRLEYERLSSSKPDFLQPAASPIPYSLRDV